jgi:hypothetical protein
MSFMAFSLALFCWIQNFTLKCHEVQLIQHIDLYLTTFACYRFFILQEAPRVLIFETCSCPFLATLQLTFESFGAIFFETLKSIF